MFMGHRRSLLSNHPYRGMSSEFDGHSEYGRVRTRLSGDTALSQVSNLNTVFGKGKGRQIEQGTLMGLLLNILGKTKDGINARKDMVSWGIRLKLAPVENDKKRTYLPPACYTMSKAKKTQFCKCLHDIKVPSGYSVNIRNLVSMKDCKLQGMKSHDCHVLMAHMIPIAIRVIDPEVLDSWQRDIIITLCQLEMYFPPSFFDVMVHLVSHIVSEIKACGPIHLRNMFPFERYMGVVKGYVRNRSRPEGSIVEGYASEELIDFYTNYLEGVKGIGVPQSRHVGRLHGVGAYGNVTRRKPHNEQFATWLKDKVATNMGQPNVDRIVERLEEGPRLLVKTYQGYEINGYTFYTKMRDEKSTVQNSRVTWVNNSSGVKVDEYGFTLVDLGTDGYTSEPFILAKQATQIFFIQDPSNPRWHVVMPGKWHILGVDNVVDEEEYNQFD
ncbi:hypothetical protein Tco_1007789 [Tanacetum coccineum]